MSVVITGPRRVDRETLKAFAPYGVATVHEAQGRTGLMGSHMRPIYPGASVSGTAVTVLLHPGDNWMMHVAAEQIQPGDVVVAAITAECTDGFFGDLLATSFKARGARALIIDAGVRDVKTLTEMGFPVWSKAVHAQGTVKEAIGCINVPVAFFDSYIAPVFAKRKAVVYVHPTTAPCCSNLVPDIPIAMIEYGTDTTRTIASLVFSGSATSTARNISGAKNGRPVYCSASPSVMVSPSWRTPSAMDRPRSGAIRFGKSPTFFCMMASA